MQKSLMTMGLVAVGVITATGLTTARSRSSLRADRVASTEQSLVREAAPFNRLVHNRVDELKLELSRLASAHAPGERAASAFDSEYFDGMAWIEPSAAAENSAVDYSTKWVSQGANIDADWLQSLPLRNLHDGDAIFIHRAGKTADGDSSIEGLLITAESFAPGATVVEGQGHRVVLFGVLNPTAFAGLVDDWVGSSRMAQIFDEKGVVLSHTNRRSIGAQLKEEGIVQAMASGKRGSASGVFDDREGRPLVAQAERIPQTNLRIALSVPQRLLDQTISGTVQTVFWLSLLGFGLLAVFGYWVYQRLLNAPRLRSKASVLDDNADNWMDITALPAPKAKKAKGVEKRGLMGAAKSAFTPIPQSDDELPAALRSIEIPATIRVEEQEAVVRTGLAARIAEAKNATSGETTFSFDEPIVAQEATPVLTFADIEDKAKLNVKAILDRSAAIRARLNLDFVEDFTTLPAAPEPEIEALPQVSEKPAAPSTLDAIEWSTLASALTDFTDDKPVAKPASGFVRKPKIKKQTEPNV